MYCWLDETVNSTQNKPIKEKICEIVSELKTFEQSTICEKYIRDHSQKQMNLIVSGGLGRDIIPRIHDYPQLTGFYVFCQDRKRNEEWANQYIKARGVCTKQSELIHLIQNQEDDDSLTIITDAKKAAQNARNAKFLWFQLFIDVLIRTQHRARDRDDLIQYCRKASTLDNDDDRHAIDEFETSYESDKAIWWYTQSSCFYKLMNKALRNQDFDTLYVFRCFITDVAKQLQERYQNVMRTTTQRSTLTLYRGQVISIAELDALNNSINGYVSMNSFLSTSRKKSKALQFAENAEVRGHTRRILFEIEINPRFRTKPFADITDISEFEDEKEVLIMVGALFLINKVIKDEQNRMWIAHVTLVDEDKFELQGLFVRMKQDIGDETNGNTLAKLLLRMDENEQAKQCYRRLLKENEIAKADFKMGMGCTLTRCGDVESIPYLTDALKIRQKFVSDDHPSLGENHSCLGEAYRKQKDYDQAEQHLKKALGIQEKLKRRDDLALADTYDRLGKTYMHKKKFTEAENHFVQVLSIRKKKLPTGHPQLAGIYGNLGWLCESRGKYEEALGYYEETLKIAESSLPPTHRLIVGTQESIRKLKSKLKS